VDVGSGGSACSTELCVALDALPRDIMHKPKAHMIAHGASERIKGANPTTVSQFQPSANPATTTAVPLMTSAHRLLKPARIKSRVFCVGSAADMADGLTMSNCCMVLLLL